MFGKLQLPQVLQSEIAKLGNVNIGKLTPSEDEFERRFSKGILFAQLNIDQWTTEPVEIYNVGFFHLSLDDKKRIESFVNQVNFGRKFIFYDFANDKHICKVIKPGSIERTNRSKVENPPTFQITMSWKVDKYSHWKKFWETIRENLILSILSFFAIAAPPWIELFCKMFK